MSLKYGLLGLLALFSILLLLFKNYEIWTFPIEVTPERGVARRPGSKGEMPSAVGAQRTAASAQSYIGIAQKNIFNPERKDFPIQAPPEVKKPPVRPQVILSGVAIVGDKQFASILNAGKSPRKEGRETITVRVGDSVGEYKVVKILTDRILLEGAEESFEVLLHDPKVERKRSYVKTENKPAAVTSLVPSPAAAPEAAKTPPRAALDKPPERPVEIPRPQISRPVPTPPSPSPSPAPVPSAPLRRGRIYPTRPGMPVPASPEATLPAEPPLPGETTTPYRP
jgi:hypothetical protein